MITDPNVLRAEMRAATKPLHHDELDQMLARMFAPITAAGLGGIDAALALTASCELEALGAITGGRPELLPALDMLTAACADTLAVHQLARQYWAENN